MRAEAEATRSGPALVSIGPQYKIDQREFTARLESNLKSATHLDLALKISGKKAATKQTKRGVWKLQLYIVLIILT